MANLPFYPILAEEYYSCRETNVRLVAYGPLPERPEDTFVLEMKDEGRWLSEVDPTMGGAPLVWIEGWGGEKVLLRSAENEPDFSEDLYGPSGDDQLWCADDDERATGWMREVTREEFDRAVELEALNTKMAPLLNPLVLG